MNIHGYEIHNQALVDTFYTDALSGISTFMIQIRDITETEYPLLEDFLYHAIYIPEGEEYPPRKIIHDPEIYVYIKGFGLDADCGVVAELDGTIIGAAWTRIIPAYGHIDNDTPELAISVLMEYRSQGIGTMLMNRLFEMLRERGYKRTSLSVQQNNPAVRFYKRLGYTITDEKVDHIGHEDYIMVKIISDKMDIYLREWELEDAPDLAAAINNKKVLDNLRDGIPYPYTEKDAEEFIATTLSAEKSTQYAFAICYGDRALGSIGVFRKDNVHRYTAEMGYYIAEPYWGKKIMTEAVRQMCGYIFENTDIIRIFAEPYAHNSASCRVLEKAGFQFEGILRQNAFKNGQPVDMRMYAIIKNQTEPLLYFSSKELSEAHRSLLSTLNKCEKVLESKKLPQSQRTLIERRITALKLALTLIEKEQKIG